MSANSISVPHVHLPKPENLPLGWGAFAELSSLGRSAVTAVLDARSAPEKRFRLRDALGVLPPPSLPATAYDPVFGESADGTAHDVYCRVVRVSGDATALFVGGALQILLRLAEVLERETTSLEPEQAVQMFAAIESVLSAAVGKGAVAHPAAGPSLASAADAVAPRPMDRWIFGHHVFVVLIQGLIVALHHFESVLTASGTSDVDGEGALDAALRHLTELLTGSAIALRFTGAFSVGAYNDTVRPSMMPPAAPKGMSGLLSSDHAFLVHRLTALKPRFATLTLAHQPAYRQFRDAFASTYDAHRFVCQQFTGDEKASLRTTAKAEVPAVEVLDRFKRSRLALFPESPDPDAPAG
ncbi:hypothetical protein [Azospirillum sp. B510]|uniref:hypothetical protein n=1 Tax=Azospirillum sp. (strain B510) TaxID=137722 RepID=UPI0011D07512|nr:hypothetical protein [Azospirillum sp. B510]